MPITGETLRQELNERLKQLGDTKDAEWYQQEVLGRIQFMMETGVPGRGYYVQNSAVGRIYNEITICLIRMISIERFLTPEEMDAIARTIALPKNQVAEIRQMIADLKPGDLSLEP